MDRIVAPLTITNTKRKIQIQIILIFLVFAIMQGFSPSIVSGSKGIETVEFRDKDQHDYASFLFKESKYVLSALEFGRLIEFFPASPLIPDAQYKMAEAYLMAGMYKEAYEQFQLYLWNFPKGRYASASIVRRELALDLSIQDYPILPPSAHHPEPSIIEISERETIRAVQAPIFEAKTYEEVEEDIKILKENGYNTLILRVFHNRGDRVYPFVSTTKTSGVYFQTEHVPVIEDVLGRFVDIAHKHGLKLFAWMTTRYADYGMEDKMGIRCKAYDFATNALKKCRGLDLFTEEAVSHLEALYRDLSLYPIDGILFQDDLVLRHSEGFGETAQALYLKEKGRRLVPSMLYTGVRHAADGRYRVGYNVEFWEWSKWKNKRLLMVAKRLMEVVRKENHDVKFAINLMYESVSNPKGALAWLSQNLEETLNTGFDFYAVMAYHRQIQEELNLSYPDTLQFISRMTKDILDKVKEPERVIMKVQLIDWKTSQDLPQREIDDILRGILKEGKVSIALIPYRKNLPMEEVSTYYHAAANQDLTLF